MANFSQEMLNVNDSLQPTHVSKMKLIAPSIFIPVAVLGLILNVGTILTVLKSRQLSNKGVHVLLVNKAVADLITSLTYPTVYAALPFGQEAELELLIISTFGSLGIYLSLLWNAAISIERFVVIHFPLKSLVYTKKMKVILTTIVWLIGIVGSTLLTLLTMLRCQDSTQSLQEQRACALFTFDRHNDEIMVGTTVPAAIILTMYTLVVKKLFRASASTSAHSNSGSVSTYSSPCKGSKNLNRKGLSVEHKQITIMLLVDSVVTVITWIPWRIIFKDSCSTTAEQTHHTPCQSAVHLTTTFVWMSNCFTTPLVYFTLNKRFRVS